MKTTSVIVALMLVLCLANAAEKGNVKADKVNISSEKEAVLEAFKAWSKANDEKDIDKMASFFAEDSGSYIDSKFQGRAALVEFWKDTYAKGGSWIGYPPEKIEVSSSGDMAYLIFDAQYKRSVEGETKTTDKYSLLLVWKKQSGNSWKIVAFK
jgi:ketosteroid isomerase-like protein